MKRLVMAAGCASSLRVAGVMPAALSLRHHLTVVRAQSRAAQQSCSAGRRSLLSRLPNPLASIPRFSASVTTASSVRTKRDKHCSHADGGISVFNAKSSASCSIRSVLSPSICSDRPAPCPGASDQHGSIPSPKYRSDHCPGCAASHSRCLCDERIRRRRWLDQLRTQHLERLAPCGCVCRDNPQRDQARGIAGRATD